MGLVVLFYTSWLRSLWAREGQDLLPPSMSDDTGAHILDSVGPNRPSLALALALSALLFGSFVEEKIFRLVRARFVPGDEPWNVWKRARRMKERQTGNKKIGEKGGAKKGSHLERYHPLGSVRRV